MIRAILIVLLLSSIIDSAQAIVTSDEFGSHVVTAGETPFGVNTEGVGLFGGDVPGATSIQDLIAACSGSLITDRHILTAAHCADDDMDGEVDFLLRTFPYVMGFELPDQTLTIQVNTDTIQFAPGWPDNGFADLAVMELLEDAPIEIPRYPLYGGTDEVGKRFVIAGYGATGHGETGVDDHESLEIAKRAGLNRYDAIRDDVLLAADFDSGVPANNALRITGFDSDLGFGADEVIVASGDSGGPAFIHGSIAGVLAQAARMEEADVDDVLNSSWGEVQFDIRVSQFKPFLLTATNHQAMFVPEPTSHLLLWIGLLGAWRHQRSGVLDQRCKARWRGMR